jgi:hypothetical protein
MRQVEEDIIDPSFADDQNTFLVVKFPKKISIHAHNLSVPSTILYTTPLGAKQRCTIIILR